MGSEDLVVERDGKRVVPNRQVKVDVERYSKEQATGAESLADVQGTGPVKR
jgi:hypothetical protein